MSRKKVKKILHDDGWTDLLHQEFEKSYMKKVMKTLKHERKKTTVHPSSHQVFRAFQKTPLEEVKVIIIGQDPYTHEAANGLAFSYDGGYQEIPASLKNIFDELERDLGLQTLTHNPDLTRWAEQGVLLLNTVLTVRHGQPSSHSNIGWQQFTRRVIEIVGHEKARFKVFLLWGNHAQSFLDKGYIDLFSHVGLRASHPSPRSAHLSFKGCSHFSKANTLLEENGYKPIQWVEEAST